MPARKVYLAFTIGKTGSATQSGSGFGPAPDFAFNISLAVEPHIAAVLVDLEPEAIPLGFVQPIVAFGWTNGCRGGEGTDERETWHGTAGRLL